jgi:CBS domain-containing protein
MRTKVKDIMTPNPECIAPDATLREAAQRMEALGCGVLPVGDPQAPQGIITDRDIVIRAVAKGKDVNKEQVRAYMTDGVCCCKEDDTLEQAANRMREYQVNRLLVEDIGGRVCGILTFGGIVRKDGSVREIGSVIECAVGNKAA